MRLVVQRVSRASVTVDGEVVGSVERGLMVLVGVAEGDTEREAGLLATKLAGLRIFPDDAKPMNRSVVDVGGSALVVSQFTLIGDVRKGRRPSFTRSAAPCEAERLYEVFTRALRDAGVPCEQGRFAADMQVELVNDGPVTFVMSCEPGGVVQ